MDFDIITTVNLVLCVLIIVAGYLAYNKDKNAAWLYVALAFSLFGLSHLVKLAGAEESLYDPMVAVRALGYLLVLFAIYKGTMKAPAPQALAPARHSRRKK
jgi:hypothetical protein